MVSIASLLYLAACFDYGLVSALATLHSKDGIVVVVLTMVLA